MIVECPDELRPHARLVVIGEAPGGVEVVHRRPFVGAAGAKQDAWMLDAGLVRESASFLNVCQRRPTANKIETVPKAELTEWVESLHERLAALDDPWLLVPTGNTALRALTGHAEITKHRGSIYAYTDRRGRTIKVIPTIHPAAVLRVSRWERRCRKDWHRIASDLTFRELQLPVRDHVIHPTEAQVADFLDAVRCAPETPLALDIETTQDAILCVGFAQSADRSITIPTVGRDGETNWSYVKALCASAAPKALQNGHFDAFRLADYERLATGGHYGVEIANWQYDTMAMHHALEPTDSQKLTETDTAKPGLKEHDLAYLGSIYTRQPYWKGDVRYDKAGMWASKLDALYRYNGIDACVTWEVADILATKLREAGLWDFYLRHYQAMFAPILALMRHGFRMDDGARRRELLRTLVACITLEDKLAVLAKRPLHAKVGLSNPKLAVFLYGVPPFTEKEPPSLAKTRLAIERGEITTLRLPRRIDRKTHAVTTKEVALRQLMLRHPKAVEPVTLILAHRRQKKIGEFLGENVADADARVRSSYKFTTGMGRLASSENPKGTGRNIQNIDRELRRIFLPDEGCVLLECDLSQAEDRVVKVLAYNVTKRESLLTRARAMPWENDEHVRAARAIFPHLDAVSPQQRYVGKRTRHATNYDMRGLKHSENLLNEGIVITPAEGDRMIEAIHDADPEIREWHRWTRIQVMRHRRLVNSWGRRYDFQYERLDDDDTYRRAYAFQAQSEVADLLNQWGLIPLHWFLVNRRMRSRINAQVHDSLVISAWPDEVYPIMQFLVASLERPRAYGGTTLMIPVEFGVGTTWKKTHEWKRMPEPHEVRTVLERLGAS